VHRGELTALELLDAAIERIEHDDPRVGAVITPLFDAAREQARGLARDARYPVPFLLKDLGASARGVPVTFASSWVRDSVATEDSQYVARLRDAGLLFAGVTAVPELAIAASTESERFGPTRNPWAPERTAGGSSGGAAAAVAARMVPAAAANDGSGSIRIPASCCGVFGLKPSRLRHAPGFAHDPMTAMISHHAVTRTVRDSVALLEVIEPGVISGAAAAAREPRRLRIALSTASPSGTPVDDACVDATELAAGLLESLGHEVVLDAPTIDTALVNEALGVIEAAAVGEMLDALERELGPATEPLPPVLAALRREAASVDPAAHAAAVAGIVAAARRAGELWERCDLWLTPTLGQPPVALGEINVRDPDVDRFFARDRRFNPWTPIANWLGQPAASLPLHMTTDGLPVGVQLTAARGADELLLQVSAQLELACPWAHRKPRPSNNSRPGEPA
jgi:amidase